MSDESNQEKPYGLLFEGAVMAHEMYVSLVQGGFTEDQALKIVIEIMKGNPTK